MRRYSVHKIFGPTVQGEGGMSGAICHFIRFSGCNMWDGRPETRADSSCPFCDTDFFSHTLMNVDEIMESLEELGQVEWVTLSGGEPALQITTELVDRLHQNGYKVAVETNGTKPLAMTVDYLTLSPKLSANEIVIDKCDCLKVLWPHPNPLISPENFSHIEADCRYLQPIDTGDYDQDGLNMVRTIEKLQELRGWRLSVQIHKLIGVE